MSIHAWCSALFLLGVIAFLTGLMFLVIGAVPLFELFVFVAITLLIPAPTFAAMRWADKQRR